MGDANKLGHPVSTVKYLMPMISEMTRNDRYPIGLEEALVEYLKDDLYISHLIYPFLKKWENKLDFDKVFSMLPARLRMVLMGFMHLCDISPDYPGLLERRCSITYPYYLRGSWLNDYKELSSYRKLSHRLQEIKDEYGVDIFLTLRDLKEIRADADLDTANHDRLYEYLMLLHSFFSDHHIPYSIGGSVSLFLQLSLECSWDIDIVIFQEPDSHLCDNIIRFAETELQLMLEEKWEDYLSFRSLEHGLTLDVEINQHYKQRLDEYTNSITSYTLGNTTVHLLHYRKILDLKKGMGRLKDLNNIFKAYELLYGSEGKHRAYEYLESRF